MADDTGVAIEGGRGLLDAIRADLVVLHESWMGLVYPRQRHDRHPVLGKWRPRSSGKLFLYRGWAAVGAPLVALLYPFVLFGLLVRFHTRQIDRTATRLGLAGVVVVVGVLWGLLAAVARVQFDASGFLAVLAAAVVATASAGVAVVTHRRGGRALTVLVAYPAGMTAIFLPPVVAALFSPSIGSVVFPGSENVAIWILDNLLFVGGLNEVIRSTFDLVGVGYVLMWFGIAVPLGWFLGGLVTLAEVIRPTEEPPAGGPA